jgi:hypothetical protein
MFSFVQLFNLPHQLTISSHFLHSTNSLHSSPPRKSPKPAESTLIVSCVTAAKQPDISDLEARPATGVPFFLSKQSWTRTRLTTELERIWTKLGLEERKTSLASLLSSVIAAVSDSASDAAADAFCDQMKTEQDELLDGAESDAHKSFFPWQHGRCATRTIQLFVRSGLAIKPVRVLLDKLRLVAKLCRKSTDFQRHLELSVAAESCAAD